MDSFEGDLRLTTAAGDEQFVLYTLTPPLGKSLRYACVHSKTAKPLRGYAAYGKTKAKEYSRGGSSKIKAEKGYRHVILWTVDILEAARHLYQVLRVRTDRNGANRHVDRPPAHPLNKVRFECFRVYVGNYYCQYFNIGEMQNAIR